MTSTEHCQAEAYATIFADLGERLTTYRLQFVNSMLFRPKSYLPDFSHKITQICFSAVRVISRPTHITPGKSGPGVL